MANTAKERLRQKAQAYYGGSQSTPTQTQTQSSARERLRNKAQTYYGKNAKSATPTVTRPIVPKRTQAAQPSTPSLIEALIPANARQSFEEPTTKEVTAGVKDWITHQREKSAATAKKNTQAADALKASATPTQSERVNTGNRWIDAAVNGSNAYVDASKDKGATERGRVSNVLTAGNKGAVSGAIEGVGLITSGAMGTSDYDATFGNYADRLSDNKVAKKVSSGVDKAAKTVSEKAYKTADELAKDARESTTMAKDGLGTFGSFLVDTGIAGTQLAGDIGISALTGVSALAPMAVRSFGSGAQQARQAGASKEEQFAYGLGSAAVEMLTEKIASVSTPFKAYGKGSLDDIIDGLVGKLSKTETGKATLKVLASAVSEGGEEAISDLVNPILQKLTYNPEALKQYGDKEYWSGMLSDALVGGVLGGLGGSVDVVNGVRADKANAQAQPQAQPEQPQDAVQAPTTAPNATQAKPSNMTQEAQKPVTAQKNDAQSTVLNILAGGATNSKANTIIENPTLSAAFTKATRLPLAGTKSQQRATIKEAAGKHQAKPQAETTPSANVSKTAETTESGVNTKKPATMKNQLGAKSVGAAESLYTVRQNALNDIKTAAKQGVADKYDINNLIAAERDVARYEKDLAIFEEHYKANQRVETQRELAKKRKETAAAKAKLDKELAVAKAKAKGNEKLGKAIDHYKSVIEGKRVRQSESKQRSKLLSLTQSLDKMKLAPEVKKQVQDLIGDIDKVSKGMTEKTEINLKELKAEYEKAKADDPNFIANKQIEEKIARLDRKQISDMDISDVQELTEVLRGIKHDIKTARKEVGVEHARQIADVAEESIREISGAKGAEPTGIKGKLNGYQTETLSPKRMFKRLSGWQNGAFSSLYQNLENGQTKALDFTMRATMPFDSFMEKTDISKWTGKNAEFIDTGIVAPNGVHVRVTPAMRVSLYLHSLNSDNLRHIDGGGITIPDVDLYKKGKISSAYAKGPIISLSPSQLKSITENMTMEEKQFADLAYKFFNETSKEAINKTSLDLVGYEVASVDDYFPLNTNKNFTKSEFESLIQDGTIEGMGLLKNRVASSNPIVLEDVTSVVMRQIENVSKYYGLAIPVRNFNKVYNYTQPEYANSVKNTLNQKWDTKANQFIENLMVDLQRPNVKTDAVARLMSEMRSNFAQATFAINPSIVLKQTPSLANSAVTFGWEPVIKSLTAGRTNTDIINKYTPLLWNRSVSDISNTAVSKKASGKNKVVEKLSGVHKADELTIRRIWKAAEIYVSDNMDLKSGTDEYYKKVAEMFNRAVYDTQPNYTTLQRPQILRSKQEITKALTMFQTQRMQNYNMLIEASETRRATIATYKANKTAENEKAAKEASTTLARTISAITVSTAIIALIKQGIRKILGRDEESYLKDFASTLSGTFLGGSELFMLLDSALGDGKWYDIDIPAISVVNDLANGISSLFTAGAKVAGTFGDLNGTGDMTKFLETAPATLTKPIKDVAKAVGTLSGIPVTNVERYIVEIIKGVSPEFAAHYNNAFSLATNSTLGKATGNDIRPVFNAVVGNAVDLNDAIVDKLYKLYNGDKANTNSDAQNNYSVLPKQTPDSFTMGGQDITLSGKEKSQYDKIYDGYILKELPKLMYSPEYGKADDETAISMISALYSTATTKAKQKVIESRGDMYLTSSGRKTVDKYVDAGLPEKKAYALYKTIDALDVNASTNDGKLQIIQTIDKQFYTQAQKTALVASLYTTHDTEGNLARESLLPALDVSESLISRYLTTQDTTFINMTVPASFTDNSVEYELTDKERQLFRRTYAQYFNSRATSTASDTSLMTLDIKAYTEAKTAVIRSRR